MPSATSCRRCYTFDGQGRRTSKTVSGTTTIFVTDADNREVLEYDGTTGAIQRWYTYALGPNAVLGQMNVAAGTRSTPVPDLLGGESPKDMITNVMGSSGNTAWELQQLNSAGRLPDVNFYLNGTTTPIPNPFR